MIKSIQIQNFLSHKKTELELSPGVNIIVGETDSGKSAILRALGWLVRNRPLGDSFRSDWGGDTSVEIQTEGHVIKRRKSDRDNQYILDNPGDPTTDSRDVFTAIKSDVPEEVQDALNMTSVNLQTQFESHFLLSKSPGEVAQHFNRIAHLDKIDIGLRNILKWIRDIQGSINVDEGHLNELYEELTQYDNIDTIEGEIERLEGLENRLCQAREEQDNVQYLFNSVEDTDQEIEGESYLLGAEPLVDKILGYVDEIKEKESLVDELDRLCLDVKDIEDSILGLQNMLSAESLVDDLISVDKEILVTQDKLDELSTLVTYLERVVETEREAKKDLIQLEKDFHKYMGDTCPLCGSKLE